MQHQIKNNSRHHYHHLKENQQNILRKSRNIISNDDSSNLQRRVLSEISNIRTRHLNNVANLKSSYINNINKKETPKKQQIKKFESYINEKRIIDIDKLYEGNLCLVSEYANDIYIYLRKLENKYSIRKWSFLNNINITDKIRTVLIDWLIDVHVEYQLLQETLHISICILDRYLQKENDITKDNIQLVGITSLFIACKYEELFIPQLDDFVYLCDNTYEKKDFINMEMKILKSLNYDLGRPVSIIFLRRYNMIIQADRIQHLYSKYIIDIALLDCELCHEKPSQIAAAASYIAICLIEEKVDENFWNNILIYYSTYTYNDIKYLIIHLAKFVLKNITTKFHSVRRKYASKSQNNISSKIITSLDIFRKLAN